MTESTKAYWVVFCNVCLKPIPVAEVFFDSKREPLNPAYRLALFEAPCPDDHLGHYSISQLVIHDEPLALGFRPHPNFR
jgi:hypothetical protein